MEDPQLTVTLAKSPHWERVREIRLAALKESPDAFGSSYQCESQHPPQWWMERLDSLSCQTFLIDTDEHSGIATVGELDNPSEGRLSEVWVAPSSRGQGIGDLLLSTAIDYAMGFGYERILLDVGIENQAAQALYKRHDFICTDIESSLPAPRQHMRESQFALMLPSIEMAGFSGGFQDFFATSKKL